MRILLSLLLCFVLLQTECYALNVRDGRGGGGSFVNVVGNYAGVMLPFDPNEISDDVQDPEFIEAFNAANALAIFTLQVPQTGISTGDLVIFAKGRTYVGEISAFADTNSGKIYATLEAEFVVEEDTSSIIFIDFASIAASGRMAAFVSQFTDFSSGSGLGRITGKAHIDLTTTDLLTIPITVTDEGSFDLFVDGVKQS